MGATDSSRLVAWLASLAWLAWLAVAAAHAKHLGGRLAMETPPTAITTGETAVSTVRRNSSSLSGLPELGASLRSPLAVYTVPLGARVALTPLGVRSPGRANQSSALPDLFHIRVDLKQLGYIKYSDSPAMELKYFLVKATWTEAQAACAGDGAALYTFDHSAQLDAAMANFYPLLEPWLDLQKPGVDGGSLVCGFLNGPASGSSSLQWDDCHALHHFVCQKPASTTTKFDGQNIRVPTQLVSKTTTVTLADYLATFVLQSQIVFNLLKPMINSAAVQSPSLTPSQVSRIDSLMTQLQDFNFVSMPDIITMITTLPKAQIQQIQLATAKGVSLHAETQTLFKRYSTELNLNATQLPVVGFAGQAVRFYTIVSRVVSNALAQPTISPTQATTLQDIIKQTQTLIDDAEIAYRAMVTKAVTPDPTLAQLLQAVLGPRQAAFNILQPAISTAAAGAVTATEAAALQTAISRVQNFDFVLMPSMISMVSLNPTLTPIQLQQLVAAVTEGIATYTNVQDVTATIAPKLNFTPVQTQFFNDIITLGVSVYNTLLAIANVPSGQPTVSAAQLAQIQNLVAQTQSVINAAAGSLTTTTTTTTVAPLSPFAQLLQAVLAPGQAAFSLLQPVISAASTLTLTPTEAIQLQALISQSQSFNNQLMPSIMTMVSTNPTLTPMQMTTLQDAIAHGIVLYSAAQSLTGSLALKLNIYAAQQQAIIDVTNQGIILYGSLLGLVDDSCGQPSVTAEQMLQIQNLVAQTQSIVSAAANLFTTTTTTTTTTPSTTTAAPGPTVAQLLQAAMAPYQATFSLLQPILVAAAANSQTLTPTEAAALQAALSQVQNYNAVLMPGIIAMVEANPTLSPTQLQQLTDAVTLGATLSNTVQNIAATIGPKLNLDPAALQAIGNIANQGGPLFGALLTAVTDPSGQPKVSAALLAQIQSMISQAQSVASAAASAMATTTSSPIPTPMTRPPHGGHHHHQGSFDSGLQVILARIKGVLAELATLLRLLRSPSSAGGIRTTSAQRRQPEAMVTQLLTLRTRQAETEARVRSMTAHEQQAIAGKLEAAQRKLRTVVTDQSVYAQSLTVTSGKQQPIVELLNETVDALQPFL